MGLCASVVDEVECCEESDGSEEVEEEDGDEDSTSLSMIFYELYKESLMTKKKK